MVLWGREGQKWVFGHFWREALKKKFSPILVRKTWILDLWEAGLGGGVFLGPTPRGGAGLDASERRGGWSGTPLQPRGGGLGYPLPSTLIGKPFSHCGAKRPKIFWPCQIDPKRILGHF